jgi:hypothetical protein
MIAGSDRRAYPQLSDPCALQNQAHRMHRDSVNRAQQPPRNRGGIAQHQDSDHRGGVGSASANPGKRKKGAWFRSERATA